MDITIRPATPESVPPPIDPALFTALDESARRLFRGTLGKAARRSVVASMPTVVVSIYLVGMGHSWHALGAFLVGSLVSAAQGLARIDLGD